MPYKNPADKRRWNEENQLNSWHRHLAAERQRRFRARKKKRIFASVTK
jgi:hypothetical protein